MADYGDFDLDRSTDEAWAAFGERLSEVLSVMDDTADLTLGSISSDEQTAPFVMFTAPEPHRIVAEAAGNANLGERFHLVPAQLEQLESLGWAAPSVEGPHPSGNFVSEWSQDDTDPIADLAIATLRNVFGVQHPVFLEPSQLAEVLQPSIPLHELPDAAPVDPADKVAEVAADKQALDEVVAQELTLLFGHEPFRDSEGDFAVRVGSTMVFVRVPADGREVLVFAAIVHEVSGRSRAAEVLNDLNVQSRWVRFALIRDRVFVSMSVIARPLLRAHLRQAVREVSDVADGIDAHLADTLHGRTTFPDRDPV